MNKDKVIDEYIALRSLDCSHPDTIKNYERYIRKFVGNIKTFEGLKELDLVEYEKKISKEFSQTTLNLMNPLLKNFIKWKYPDYSLRFPTLDRIFRTKKPEPVHNADEMLTLKEIMKIIEAEDDLFWKSFWLVYAYGGYRPIDTARLKWDVFSWESDGSIVIKSLIGKNKKKFYKHIPKEVAPIIKRWKEVNPSEWVFPSPKLKGQHINSKTPANRMARISTKVLGRKVIPYVIRKSIATILYENMNDDEAADAMGHHKSMKETYARLNDAALTKRAKKVWTNKKEMPKKEKDKLLKRLEEQDKKIQQMAKQMEKLNKENTTQLMSPELFREYLAQAGLPLPPSEKDMIEAVKEHRNKNV